MDKVVVVGGGHAGCESAYALSKMGIDVLIITLDKTSLGRVSCNPSMGGIAKGHLIYEIEACGGVQPLITDRASMQYRMLNRKKGSAVWGLRAQIDRGLYERYMTEFISSIGNIEIIQDEVVDVITEDGRVRGVVASDEGELNCSAVVITTGTFLNGLLYRGEEVWEGGRIGDGASKGLERFFERVGIELGRLKTGTPSRLYWRSLDLDRLIRQDGERGILNFNYEFVRDEQLLCYIAKTNRQVHEVIIKNLDRSPLYQGHIKGIGPRYCPSIEDKVVRFSDKESHILFVEPEGWEDELCYINGLSSSLPADVQDEMIHSIEGFEDAEVAWYGYAVEYDYVNPIQLKPTLELMAVDGVFLAGQINGTSGYEEAAAQGLVAGVNAGNYVLGREPFVLARNESYIGVLIDDLVTRGVDEPYRLFTSRAEYRLDLSQYSARLRLTERAFEQGLIDRNRLEWVEQLGRNLEKYRRELESRRMRVGEEDMTGIEYIKRNSNPYNMLPIDDAYRQLLSIITVEDIRYENYRKRMRREIDEARRLMMIRIDDIDYDEVDGLSTESRQRLNRVRPANLDQASRIPGIRPSDIISLMIYRRKKRDDVKESRAG